MYKVFVKLASKLHNFSYKLVSALAIKCENGIHPKHRLIRYHQFFIDNILPTDKILDIGCGNGELAYDMAQKAKKVLAIDISEEKISKARENYKSHNLKFIAGDAASYDFGEQFDVIVLSNVLEHIEQRVEFLIKMKNLAPKILIRTPMFNRDWLCLYKKELGIEYRLDTTHFIEYTLQTLKQELTQAGLALADYSAQFGEIWGVVKTL